MWRIRFLCVFIVCFMVFIPAGVAMESVGHVSYISGDVSVIRGDNTINLKKGNSVYPSDVIVTSTSGRVKLAMSDGSHVYCGKNSRINIKRYKVSNGHLLSGVFHMFWGKARYVVAKLRSAQSDFSVRTKTATIGVRGTQFVVVVPKPSSHIKNLHLGISYLPALPTTVLLFKGSVVAQNIKNHATVMKPGHLAKFMPSGSVNVRPITKHDIKVFNPIGFGTSGLGVTDNHNDIKGSGSTKPKIKKPKIKKPKIKKPKI